MAGGWRQVWDGIRLITLAVIAAVLLRSCVAETYRVQGSSMAPTLRDGQRVLVNRLAYRLHPPRTGDIVVFRRPIPPGAAQGPAADFVKRVIATGGETVSMRDGVVSIDGRRLAEPYLPTRWRGHDDLRAITVPAGQVWVMGDNRDGSLDSRFFPTRFVPLRSIQGRAVLIWWPLRAFHSLLGGHPGPASPATPG